jgi:hypothetical protein
MMGSEMPKLLQWGLLLFFVGALIAVMTIATVTLLLYWEHNRPRNYLTYRIATADPCEALRPQVDASGHTS